MIKTLNQLIVQLQKMKDDHGDMLIKNEFLPYIEYKNGIPKLCIHPIIKIDEESLRKTMLTPAMLWASLDCKIEPSHIKQRTKESDDDADELIRIWQEGELMQREIFLEENEQWFRQQPGGNDIFDKAKIQLQIDKLRLKNEQ
jgi:hypothetical protein